MRLVLPDLLPNTDYAVQVRTNDEGVTSEWSAVFEFTTIEDIAEPLTPTSVSWVSSGDSFHGEWDAVTENDDGKPTIITRYEIELVAGGDTRVVAVPPKTDAGKLSYDLSFEENRALFGTPEFTVQFRVRAVDNKDLKSPWSAPISATNAAPNPPTGADTTPGIDAITVFWTPAADSDIIGYNVYAGTTGGFTPNSGNRVFSGLATSFTYTTTTYTERFFKIFSVDKFGQESTTFDSTSDTANSPFGGGDTTPPAPPTAFDVTVTNDPMGLLLTQTATATWTPPADSDVAGYHIRYKKTSESNWTVVTIPADSAQPYVISKSLEPDTAYNFQIRAYDTFSNDSTWVADATSVLAPAGPAELFHAIVIEGGGYIESANYDANFGFRLDEDAIIIRQGSVSADVVNTGAIQSSAPAVHTKVRHVYNEDGELIGFGQPEEVTHPTRKAFVIDTEGDMQVSNLSVLGNIVVGEAEPDSTENDPVTIATTSGDPDITATTEFFVAGHIGRTITGAGIPGGTTIADVISATEATLSANATATASGVSANVVIPIRYVSQMSSGNYVEGTAGWTLRSDGTAELRELVAESLNGDAIAAQSMSADRLSGGVIVSELAISNRIQTTLTPTPFTLTFTSGATSVTAVESFALDDVGSLIEGPGLAPNTTITGWVSDHVVNISAATLSAQTGVGATMHRGRTAIMSGEGITLKTASNAIRVDLPTNPLLPVKFTGSIVAEELTVN